jgi:hypothetical protein
LSSAFTFLRLFLTFVPLDEDCFGENALLTLEEAEPEIILSLSE